MNQLQGVARLLVPKSVRRFPKKMHREYVFRRAMKAFLANPEKCVRTGDPVLADLIYGWGNEWWSALDEYLVACLEHALTVSGPILECGSGLSTLLVGEIAKRRGLEHWALEHMPQWAAKVQTCLDRYDLHSVTLCTAPLENYGEYSWYAPPIEAMPDTFRLVICDGPPGRTQGGRFGLIPVMGDRLKSDTAILLDDAEREQEQAIVKRWRTDFGGVAELFGRVKPYIRMTAMNLPYQEAA